MNKKKIMSLIMALVMLVGVFSPLTALAEGESTEKDAKTETVTLHKILQKKENLQNNKFPGQEGLDGTKYDGNQIAAEKLAGYFGTDSKEIDGVYFALKFAADYGTTDEEKAMAGKYVKADANDKLKPASPLEATENIEEAVGGLTQKNNAGVVFKTSDLKGNFEIDEIHDKSTYKGANGETLTDMRAVPVKITLPLVNEKGTVVNAHVYPKNTEEKPDTHKDFTKEFTKEQPNGRDENTKENAAAEPHNVGDVIDYTVTTKVPANTKWKTAFWDDKMTEGLTFVQKKDATGDLEGKGISIKYDGKEMNANWYTLSETENGFTLKLTDTGLKEIAKATEEKTIRLDYHAVLNEKAVVAIPESNDVTFHYGNNEDHGNTPVPNKPNDNGELTITKNWDTGVAKKDVKFTLYNAQTGKKVEAKDVESVDGYTFENPVTIEAGETMTYTWKGLNKNIEYKVEETYDGFSVEYGKGDAGQLTAKNYKDNNPEPINPTEPKVVTGGAKFVKTNADGTERLSGAEFVIKNAEGNFLTGTDADRTDYEAAQKAFVDAIEAWNTAVKENNKKEANEKKTEEEIVVSINDKQFTGKTAVFAEIAKLEKARDDAWNATLKDMTQWGKQDNAKKFTSNELGQFEVAGLKPGKYTLVEVKAPEGYALPSNAEFEFEIGDDGLQKVKDIDFGVLDDTKDDNAMKIVNKKVTIPQTGGMGTVLFTIVGISLMAGAVVAMKRNREEA